MTFSKSSLPLSMQNAIPVRDNELSDEQTSGEMDMNEPKSVCELCETLRRGTEHLVNMAKQLEYPWRPLIEDPRKLHNMYARNLISCYVSKYADLSRALLSAIDDGNYLSYALCGRALIETTAILRYYLTELYKPLLDKRMLDGEAFRQLIEIDDKHLRGGNFDWESFLLKRYSRLIKDVESRKNRKGKNPMRLDPGALPKQVRIGPCIQKWARETPAVQIAYDLFCDLVHPNLGSTFLVASTAQNDLYFSRFRGDPVGASILEHSLPLLLSVTHKQFGTLLGVLMGTIWQDDELVTNS